MIRRLLRTLALAAAGLAWQAQAQAGAPLWDDSRDNLMVVVRESIGANKPDDILEPVGKGKVRLADGSEIEVESAWWNFIGDTHIRFVFDGEHSMRDATPQDLARLKLATAADALALALANVERVYGTPKSMPWVGGVMLVEGKSPDLDSSDFLDRAFWRGLLKTHPEGLAVAVPKRGGLLYTPASDLRSVDALRSNIARLHSSSVAMGVSSALFLFKDGHGSVLQPAVAP